MVDADSAVKRPLLCFPASLLSVSSAVPFPISSSAHATHPTQGKTSPEVIIQPATVRAAEDRQESVSGPSLRSLIIKPKRGVWINHSHLDNYSHYGPIKIIKACELNHPIKALPIILRRSARYVISEKLVTIVQPMGGTMWEPEPTTALWILVSR